MCCYSRKLGFLDKYVRDSQELLLFNEPEGRGAAFGLAGLLKKVAKALADFDVA